MTKDQLAGLGDHLRSLMPEEDAADVLLWVQRVHAIRASVNRDIERARISAKAENTRRNNEALWAAEPALDEPTQTREFSCRVCGVVCEHRGRLTELRLCDEHMPRVVDQETQDLDSVRYVNQNQCAEVIEEGGEYVTGVYCALDYGHEGPHVRRSQLPKPK